MNNHEASDAAATSLLSDAFEALAEGIAIFDAERRLLTCNARYKEMLAPIADLIEPGAKWHDLIRACVERQVYAGSGSDTEARLAEAERHLQAFTQKRVVGHSDGRVFELSYNATRSAGFVVTRAEVTERCRAEAMIQDREALLRTIFETNPTPVVMARLSDSRIIYRSPAAYDSYGDTEYASSYYVNPEDRAAYVAELRRKGRVRDRRLAARGADGREITVSVSGGLTSYNGETYVVSSVTDLTEQIEREALIRMVVESCPAPILMNRAASGEILFKSPKINALFGDINNASAFYVNPRDREGFLAALRKNGEVIEHRARFRSASGDAIWCAISARLIQWDGEDVIVSHSRDLTPQLSIEAELSRQREQMFQAEKMSALGGLLAGVAHELNNPLSVVVGHAMMLQDEVGDPELIRKTRKISEAAERCSRIIRTFLTMARQEPARMEETSLNEIVETAVEVSRYRETTRPISLKTDLIEPCPPIVVDADQLAQVVINLILNAEQAIEESGLGDTVRVSTGVGALPGSLTVTVEDNGPGISSDIRARVFEPFFTTKGVGKGTGIGLAMCHRIVTAHNGSIECAPALPGGARFTVTLPSNRPPSELPPDKAGASTGGNATARVLVIDDEPDVADLNAEVLARGGFETEVAYRAEEAFELLRARPFDVLISDLNMPGIDGRGFFEMVCAEFEDMLPRTGFITGDTMGRASQRFLQESQRPYLEKPVSPRELREFVSQLSKGGAGA